MRSRTLFPDVLPSPHVVLAEDHYLGDTNRGQFYQDGSGVVVVQTPPSSRNLPVDWLELSRWCLTDRAPNSGSSQWRRVRRWIVGRFPAATTVVSYSDPSVGHLGALYRACNWLWAPTWHRIVTPPTGNGSWDGVKTHRWIFPLRPDARRVQTLRLEDSYLRRFPWAEYREPGGADYRAFVQATAFAAPQEEAKG